MLALKGKHAEGEITLTGVRLAMLRNTPRIMLPIKGEHGTRQDALDGDAGHSVSRSS